MSHPAVLTKQQARRLWLQAQRLDETAPFGAGPQATHEAVQHLGYVQIDTINVIRALPPPDPLHADSRIPARRPASGAERRQVDLRVLDARAVLRADPRHPVLSPRPCCANGSASAAGSRSSPTTCARSSPASARTARSPSATIDDDDVLTDKDHPWASRKPSKRALQLAFYQGKLTISQRSGMLKTYELIGRHFGWDRPPHRPRRARRSPIGSSVRCARRASSASIQPASPTRHPSRRCGG